MVGLHDLLSVDNVESLKKDVKVNNQYLTVAYNDGCCYSH